MLEESTNTGVSTGESATSAGGDSGSPVVPQTTGAEVDSNTETQVESSAPPAAGGEEIPENDDDLSALPETERTPLINQRNRIRELNRWRTEAEPGRNWIDQRGGLEYVQSDVQLVDHLFSENLEDRQQAYATLFQDSSAFERVKADFVTDPMIQREVWANSDPQEVLEYLRQGGHLPQGYGSNVDPAILATIPAELQEVFRSLPPEVQEDYAKMSDGMRNWNLRRDAQLYAGQKAEQQRQQREQQAYQNQRMQAAHEAKTKTYNDVRSIIQSALAEKIPGNDQATQFVLQATETALYQSAEGAALWNELDAHIDKGEMRAVQAKLPLLVARAKAEAVKIASWLNDTQSKARQFDEMMRMGSQEDILRYLAQLRGGQKQPGPGTTPAPTNGNHMPKPELAGQYSRENILSYGSRS